MFAKFARNTAVACVSLFAVTVSATPAEAGDDDPNGIRLAQIGSDLSAAGETGKGWVVKGWVPVGEQGGFYSDLENDIDAVDIVC